MSKLSENPRPIAAIHTPTNSYRVGVNTVQLITCVDDAGPGGMIPYLHVFVDSDTEWPTLSVSAENWLVERYPEEVSNEPAE